jgi:hypothetical protein
MNAPDQAGRGRTNPDVRHLREGEGGPYVSDVGIGLGSRLPVNADGALLSYAWNGTQHMTLRVIELVRQLRGTAVHRVPGAEVGLAAALERDV